MRGSCIVYDHETEDMQSQVPSNINLILQIWYLPGISSISLY